MTILITGATGKTSTRLIPLLKAENVPYVLAARRSPSTFPNEQAIKFDWFDESTYAKAFKEYPSISAVYLIPPEIQEPAPSVNKFIDVAIEHGVKKFVFMGGSTAVKGGPYVGKIWSHLEETGVDFAFLRPTWLMQNFSEAQHYKSTKESNMFATAADDGKVWYVSAEDVAKVAFVFLSGKKPYGKRDYILQGPELLSHDDVAAILSDVLGRRITHEHKSMEEMVEHYTSLGLQPAYASLLPYLENNVKNGCEEKLESDLEQLIGTKGTRFETWAKEEGTKAL